MPGVFGFCTAAANWKTSGQRLSNGNELVTQNAALQRANQKVQIAQVEGDRCAAHFGSVKA